jgi:hypothetical protein
MYFYIKRERGELFFFFFFWMRESERACPPEFRQSAHGRRPHKQPQTATAAAAGRDEFL